MDEDEAEKSSDDSTNDIVCQSISRPFLAF